MKVTEKQVWIKKHATKGKTITCDSHSDTDMIAHLAHMSSHMPVVVQFCWPCLWETAAWAADFLAAHFEKKHLANDTKSLPAIKGIISFLN